MIIENWDGANLRPRPQDRKSGRQRLIRADFLSVANDLLVVWDLATISAAGYVCSLIYGLFLPPHIRPDWLEANVGQMVLVGGVVGAAMLRGTRIRLTSAIQKTDRARFVTQIARKVSMLVCVMLAIGFLTRTLDAVPRLWVLGWALSTLLLAIGGRLSLASLIHVAVRHGICADHVAIVGSGPQADHAAQLVRDASPGMALELVGVFTDYERDPWADGSSLNSLFKLGQEGRIDRVILALPPGRDGEMAEIVERLKSLDIEASFFPVLPVMQGITATIGKLADAPLIVLSPRPIHQWGLIAKSVLDVFLAGISMLLLAPLLIAIAVAVKLDSPGPVIFRQLRHGRNNSEIVVFKFRTMTHSGPETRGNDAGQVLQQTKRVDARITKVGQFLRRTSLDELAQLFNVLNGTMSLVGPRPHAVHMRTEDLLGEQIISQYPQRHRIKPGITGWAQIKGHRGATETVEQVRERVRHDIHYIENWSILFDLRILLATPFSIIFKRDNAF